MIDPYRFAPWVSPEAKALFATEVNGARAPEISDIAAIRAHYDSFNQRHLEVAREHYPVTIVRDEMGGIAVDVVTPDGIDGRHKTLICLHGGAFMWGCGAGALLEAIPVAATAKMRVIAIEYSLSPETLFPAAVNDVLAVFGALCSQQPAGSIGIYGCSAGGILTAQAIARMVTEGIPKAGAIAMLHGTGLEMDGDSRATAAALTGETGAASTVSVAEFPYLSKADPADPLVFPGEHLSVLAQFPPSLLVTGTRDFAASSVATMHRRLLAAGVEASLLHFDGMWHAHHMATTLPESRETFAAMAEFFGKHLV